MNHTGICPLTFWHLCIRYRESAAPSKETAVLPWAAVSPSLAVKTGVRILKKTSKKGRTIHHRKHSSILNTELRKAIQAEAAALGLTPHEYIRLAIGVAKNIRESFGSGQEKDAHQLLSMIQNPLFVILLRTVAESFLNKATTKTDNLEIGTGSTSNQAQPLPQHRVQYEEMWDFW
jgi:hypothetical protein